MCFYNIGLPNIFLQCIFDRLDFGSVILLCVCFGSVTLRCVSNIFDFRSVILQCVCNIFEFISIILIYVFNIFHQKVAILCDLFCTSRHCVRVCEGHFSKNMFCFIGGNPAEPGGRTHIWNESTT